MDKSGLPKEVIKKQKLKGTYDSPCMSVCNYSGPDQMCQTCFMLKSEKQTWKNTQSEEVKNKIRSLVEERK